MKFIFIILFIFLSNSVFGNEDNNDDVEVINLHESKSLDQLVLENLNSEEGSEELVESLNETNETDEIETNTVEVKQLEIIKIASFVTMKRNYKNYFLNLQN